VDAYLQSVATYFGFPRLVLQLNERSRKRIMRVSILPAAVFVAQLIGVSLRIKFGVWQDFPEPEFWQRVGATSSLTQALLPLAVAVVFASGFRPWGRAEGSWMFLIGAALAAVSLGLGLSAALMYALFSPDDAQLLHADAWAGTASDAGFLAVGYFFVAYRSLAVASTPLTSPRGPRSRSR
jgi:hypothetical protein